MKLGKEAEGATRGAARRGASRRQELLLQVWWEQNQEAVLPAECTGRERRQPRPEMATVRR